MAWLKNKLTGLVWDVEGELAERLSRNPAYEAMHEAETRLGDMKVADLRELAKEKGIEGADGMKKPELIAALSGDKEGE